MVMVIILCRQNHWPFYSGQHPSISCGMARLDTMDWVRVWRLPHISQQPGEYTQHSAYAVLHRLQHQDTIYNNGIHTFRGRNMLILQMGSDWILPLSTTSALSTIYSVLCLQFSVSPLAGEIYDPSFRFFINAFSPGPSPPSPANTETAAPNFLNPQNLSLTLSVKIRAAEARNPANE